jgi:hypothetical protein
LKADAFPDRPGKAFLTPYIIAWIIGPEAEENIQGGLIQD